MEPDLKKKIRNHRIYLGASIASLALGMGLIGTQPFMFEIKKPEIYKEHSSAQYEVRRLQETRQELGKILRDEEISNLSQLEELIESRRNRIAEIEKTPEFIDHEEDYRISKSKKDGFWYGGFGLYIAGIYGFLKSLRRAGKIRSEYESQQNVKSE